jgi:hypothetical protein
MSNLKKKNKMKGASSEWKGKKKALASEKDKEVVYEGAHLYSSIFKKTQKVVLYSS